MSNIAEIEQSRSDFDAVIGSDTSTVIDPNVVLTGGAHNPNGFYFYINNPVAGDNFTGYDSGVDRLELTDADVASVVGDDADKLDISFDTATGVLKCVVANEEDHDYFDIATWQSLARKVAFKTSGGSSATKNVRYTLGNKLALETEDERIIVPEVHAFENEDTTVDEIISAIEDKTYFGIQGHLATIRDVEVNQFVKDKIRNADGTTFDLVLLGARTTSDSAPDHKKFEWFTGPDAGLLFWDNGAVSDVYSEFNTNEPNHTSTTTNYINVTDNGKWNDTVIPNYNWTNKYLVIYEANSADLKFSVNYTINLQAAEDVATELIADLNALRQRVKNLENKQDIHAKLDECVIEDNSLILTLNNGETINLGNVKGPQGNPGDDFNGDARVTANEEDIADIKTRLGNVETLAAGNETRLDTAETDIESANDSINDVKNNYVKKTRLLREFRDKLSDTLDEE